MKIMISVGEASGDLHGARVAQALQELCPGVSLLGMGGDAMRKAGVNIVYDIAGLGVIGIIEILKNLRRLFALRDFLVETMRRERPDVLVVIDYPGFNMRLAKKAKELNIPVVSYISPSAWAWGKGRAKSTAKIVDRVAAIFPFEAKVYEEAGAHVSFVGHPLLDIVKPALSKEEAFRYFQADPKKKRILLMPGSRQQEIHKLFPVMLAAAKELERQIPDTQFFLPLASTIAADELEGMIQSAGLAVTITRDHTYDIMNITDLAIATSGTATLEAALMGLPVVIMYRVNKLTYFLGKPLVKIPHIGLPNIVAGRKVVPELLQDEVTVTAIVAESLAILRKESPWANIAADLADVRHKLGEPGAVKRAAAVILEVAAQSGGK
ncbi:MAG: lipid-A-disaccharide synthase [Sporomusaceae bacterium]|nr:lipid-A-disaccharide synthase [Sporomusaceae bacterium]